MDEQDIELFKNIDRYTEYYKGTAKRALYHPVLLSPNESRKWSRDLGCLAFYPFPQRHSPYTRCWRGYSRKLKRSPSHMEHIRAYALSLQGGEISGFFKDRWFLLILPGYKLPAVLKTFMKKISKK